jgi:hypothetical protein
LELFPKILNLMQLIIGKMDILLAVIIAKHNLGVCSKFAEREAKKGSIIEIIVDLEMGKMFHFDLFYNEYFYVNLL